jgi:hypothetical protein
LSDTCRRGPTGVLSRGIRDGCPGGSQEALAAVTGDLRIAQLAELGQRTPASGQEAIAQVAELVQRVSGVDVAVLSEIRDGGYRFAGLERCRPCR